MIPPGYDAYFLIKIPTYQQWGSIHNKYSPLAMRNPYGALRNRM